MNELKPYIGITGFTSLNQINYLNHYKSNDNFDLMFGVLISQKTLNGQKPSNPNRYPELNCDLFRSDYSWPKDILKFYHYNFRNQNLFEELSLISSAYGGDGIQLNIVWPTLSELQKYKQKFSNQRLVLQISDSAFHQVDCNINNLIEKLKPYSNVGVTDFLFDLSGGTGKSIDVLGAWHMCWIV